MSLRLLLVLPVLFTWLGCRQQPGTGPRQAAAEPGIASVDSLTAGRAPADHDDWSAPASVVCRVNELRRGAHYTDLLQHVVEEQRQPIHDLLRAVDQLLSDNRLLQDRITAAIGAGVATVFDRAGAANVCDVFSYDVKVLGERIDGDGAVVTIQVGQRLPLSTVRLVRAPGGWLIEPDPPIPGLAAELRNLGKALRRTAQTIEQRRMTPDQIRKEVEFWQAPVLRRIEKLIRDSRPNQP